MKRILIASVLGLAASTLTAFGQTGVLFDNYGAGPVQWTNNPAWAPPGRADSLVELADGIVANLLWQFGTNQGDAGLRTPVGNPPGYFSGPLVIIPGYTGLTPITLTVQAWSGIDYASATARGSVTWTEPFLSPGPNALNMPTLVVQLVPEPSALALMGLGAGMMMIGRRRR